MKANQLEFSWPDPALSPEHGQQIGGVQSLSSPSASLAESPKNAHAAEDEQQPATLNELTLPPLPTPSREAVEAGVFGLNEDGAINPDAEEVLAITEEHAREMMATLSDLQAAEHGLRTGHDPRTGRIPRTPDTREKLRKFLVSEVHRLKSAYGDALAAYAQGFGDDATAALDLWVRKNVAGTASGIGRYDPGHPWHYLLEGDNAPPIPVDEIEGDREAGSHIELNLPKNRAKRKERLREMLVEEQQRVQEDRRRYQEIVEQGVEALSRYDREIAHTSDAMARATALSLKFNHIRFGLGRIAWIERELAR